MKSFSCLHASFLLKYAPVPENACCMLRAVLQGLYVYCVLG